MTHKLFPVRVIPVFLGSSGCLVCLPFPSGVSTSLPRNYAMPAYKGGETCVTWTNIFSSAGVILGSVLNDGWFRTLLHLLLHNFGSQQMSDRVCDNGCDIADFTSFIRKLRKADLEQCLQPEVYHIKGITSGSARRMSACIFQSRRRLRYRT